VHPSGLHDCSVVFPNAHLDGALLLLP